MRKFIFISAIFLSLVLGIRVGFAQRNKLTEQEKKEGWKLLFDGESTEHWRGYNKDQFPEKEWVIKNGALTVLPGNGGGTIITKEKYDDFILKLEWKVKKGADSGILYHAIEQPREAIYWSGLEMQVVDNKYHYTEEEINKCRKAGALYGIIPAKPQNARPYGEWNSVKIVVDDAHVEHWQNGVKVVEFTMWTSEWYEMVRNSKFESHPAFGDAHKGYIGLLDEGYQVSYRNIKIKELD